MVRFRKAIRRVIRKAIHRTVRAAAGAVRGIATGAAMGGAFRAAAGQVKRRAAEPAQAVRRCHTFLRPLCAVLAAVLTASLADALADSLAVSLADSLAAGDAPHAKAPSGQTPEGGEPVFGPIHFAELSGTRTPQDSGVRNRRANPAGRTPGRFPGAYSLRRRAVQTVAAVSSPRTAMPATPVTTDEHPPDAAVVSCTGAVVLSAGAAVSDCVSVCGAAVVSGSVGASVSLSVTVVAGSCTGSVSVSVSFGRRDSL